MKICAIIAEYNPFHNGHKYQLQQAKKITNADAILVIMSGDFVQRAEGAIFNKYLRAKAALTNGADFVIELPTVIATSCGQIFAEGAVNILNQFPDIEYLCFGCEDNNLLALQDIANIQLEESNDFKNILKQNLQNGLSYASSYNIATSKIADLCPASHAMSHITKDKPNNMLAIEYIKALKKINSKIKPIAIQRVGSDYNSLSSDKEFISASGARKLFDENNYELLKKFIPQNIVNEFVEEYCSHKLDKKTFESLVICSLRNDTLEELFDANGTLEKAIKDNSFRYLNLDELLQNTKSKCYSYSRIRRLCLQAVLKITKDLGKNFSFATTRLLGIKENLRTYISAFPPIVTIKNTDINALSGIANTLSNIDKRASNIYSLLTNTQGNQFYENKLLIVK